MNAMFRKPADASPCAAALAVLEKPTSLSEAEKNLSDIRAQRATAAAIHQKACDETKATGFIKESVSQATKRQDVAALDEKIRSARYTMAAARSGYQRKFDAVLLPALNAHRAELKRLCDEIGSDLHAVARFAMVNGLSAPADVAIIQTYLNEIRRVLR